MFCLLVLIMLVPIIFICRKRNRLYDSRNTSSDNNRKCIDKIELNFKEGLKISKLSSLYYTFFLFRNLIFAILVVCTNQKFQQLFIFIILNIVFLLYVAAIRPFQSKFHNLISIMNESCFLLCSLLMILFLNNGNQMTIIGIVIIALFSINIIFCFGAGVIYSFIYLFKQKCRRNVRNIVVGKEVKRYFTQKPEQDKEQEYEQEEQTINKEVQNNKPHSVFPSIFQKHEEQKYNFDEDQSGEKRPSIKDSNFALPVIGVK